MELRDDFIWCQKYRPRTIEDCILPRGLKDTFLEFVSNGDIPNLLLSGTAGTGKTTVARALCEELGVDYIIINGSESGNIDTLRNDVRNFASGVSITSTASGRLSFSMRLTILIHNRLNLHFVGLLKSSLRTVDSSLLVISRIVSLNRFIVGVVLLIFAFPRRIAQSSQ